MARIVSLLLPAQIPPGTTVLGAEPRPGPLCSEEEEDAATGFDCNMIVHSASCTWLSSVSQNWTGWRQVGRG